MVVVVIITQRNNKGPFCIHFNMMVMMMIIRPFGQLGLMWAPSFGVRDVYTPSAYVFTQLTVIEESGLPR